MSAALLPHFRGLSVSKTPEHVAFQGTKWPERQVTDILSLIKRH